MVRRILSLLVAGLMLLAPASVYAKGFSGGHSTGSSSSYSRSYHGSPSVTKGTTSGSTYHSGYRSPSPNVRSGSSYTNPNTGANRSRGGFLSHAAAFGAGTLLGSMLHPFGGGYGYGPGMGGGFSIFGILLDILIIWIVYKVVKGLFARRRY
ncbi:hypothetical protein PP175_15480 [Aneurinibacillus sp. Ricciae_BoGa-3]|uniref:hypothetical protein n=1 Tax=Aneurinibacillus sp. Ricciae_BoGa-3 TaxID=3022697 RepID=UPI002342088D|nr:hypothetical protein [Aneurinibacillus sp. Ricciae_BoGa-3]WCK52822.1 hypothetical protein PP175_15480 [Aneurinibacillus sp. Ricciae_BoGa-3]